MLLATKLNTSQALEKLREMDGEDAAFSRPSSSAASAELSSSYEARPDRGEWAVSISAAGCGASARLCCDGCSDPRRDRAEINHRAAADERITVHWLSLGELSRLIEVFHKEGVTRRSWPGRSSTSRFLKHSAGLAAGQAAAEPENAQHRYAAGSHSEGAGRRGN